MDRDCADRPDPAPALIWIDGTALVAGLVWLPLVCAVIVVAAASPLLRVRSSALVLGSGVVASILVLWVTDAYVIPRYLSFLLVPWFVMVATGAAALLSGSSSARAPVRALLCLIVLAVLAARFAVLAPDVVALPREANRDAARVIEERGTTTPVITYMRNPANLVFYLGETGGRAEPEALEASVCDRRCRRLLRLPAVRASTWSTSPVSTGQGSSIAASRSTRGATR